MRNNLVSTRRVLRWAATAPAAGVAQKALHEDGIRLCGQLLIYPVTDSDGKSPSAKAFANVPPFKNALSSLLWGTYLGHPVTDGVPAYASPLHGNVAGVATAYVETAEFDPLRDEGNAYAHALRDQGVDVTMNAVSRAVHGFDLLVPKSAISKAAVESRIQFLRKVYA